MSTCIIPIAVRGGIKKTYQGTEYTYANVHLVVDYSFTYSSGAVTASHYAGNLIPTMKINGLSIWLDKTAERLLGFDQLLKLEHGIQLSAKHFPLTTYVMSSISQAYDFVLSAVTFEHSITFLFKCLHYFLIEQPNPSQSPIIRASDLVLQAQVKLNSTYHVLYGDSPNKITGLLQFWDKELYLILHSSIFWGSDLIKNVSFAIKSWAEKVAPPVKIKDTNPNMRCIWELFKNWNNFFEKDSFSASEPASLARPATPRLPSNVIGDQSPHRKELARRESPPIGQGAASAVPAQPVENFLDQAVDVLEHYAEKRDKKYELPRLLLRHFVALVAFYQGNCIKAYEAWSEHHFNKYEKTLAQSVTESKAKNFQKFYKKLTTSSLFIITIKNYLRDYAAIESVPQAVALFKKYFNEGASSPLAQTCVYCASAMEKQAKCDCDRGIYNLRTFAIEEYTRLQSSTRFLPLPLPLPPASPFSPSGPVLSRLSMGTSAFPFPAPAAEGARPIYAIPGDPPLPSINLNTDEEDESIY